MTTAAAIVDANISEGVRLALQGRRLWNRVVHRVDCDCFLTPAGFDPETGEGVVIGCKCGAMENRDPATLLPFPPEPPVSAEVSEGIRRALLARRGWNRLVHGIDCDCRIDTAEDKPAACSCGNATVGRC